MIPAKERARELVLSFYYALPNNGSTEGINSTTRRYQEGIRCALIAVEQIDLIYQKLTPKDDPYYFLLQLEYWQEVKQELQAMKTEDSIISDWLQSNNNPQIEIRVLNELVDKLIQQNKLLNEELDYEKRKTQ